MVWDTKRLAAPGASVAHFRNRDRIMRSLPESSPLSEAALVGGVERLGVEGRELAAEMTGEYWGGVVEIEDVDGMVVVTLVGRGKCCGRRK